MISPWEERTKAFGMTFGLSYAGYDFRIAETFNLWPGEFKLGSTIEHFRMPLDILGIVHDKSTWARRGLSVFNTVLEPGWTGHLTVELSNRGNDLFRFEAGMPIAQLVGHLLDVPIMAGYDGKYQSAKPGAQPAIME